MECLAAGITTVGDNTDAGVTMRVLTESGLRGIVYQELFGIDDREPVAPIMDALREKIAVHRQMSSERVGVGVSPHALYTIRPALFAAIKAYVAEENLPTSIHIAESPAESRLTEQGEGEFAEMYARRGIHWDVPHLTPTQYAAAQGALTPTTLAVHCVHQTPDDTALLASTGSAVIHCPKSNAKLGAGIAPLARWLRTDGLRVGLGTDSAVSNNTLDLFEEMRFALLMQRARLRRRGSRHRPRHPSSGDPGRRGGDGSGMPRPAPSRPANRPTSSPSAWTAPTLSPPPTLAPRSSTPPAPTTCSSPSSAAKSFTTPATGLPWTHRQL